MTSQHVKTVERHNETIRNSIEQILTYLKDSHIIKEQELTDLYRNIETVDVAFSLRIFENTNSIVSELGHLLKTEQKRRLAKTQLEEAEKRGAVKKQLKERTRSEEKARAKANPYTIRSRGFMRSIPETSQEHTEITPETSREHIE